MHIVALVCFLQNLQLNDITSVHQIERYQMTSFCRHFHGGLPLDVAFETNDYVIVPLFLYDSSVCGNN